ncbi:hypothetical protein V8F33_008757 [Rhypophila sp. PSN 637]
MIINMSPFADLGPLPGLDATTLEGLSPDQQQSIITDVSKICRKMMENLGVTWKPQPVDPTLRTALVEWIKNEVQTCIGKPVNKAFLLSADGSAIFTEYVYEDHDAQTKLCMAKILTLCLYLDDLAEKDDGMASQAELFLFKMLDGGLSSNTCTIPPQYRCWLELFRKHSLDLARCMSDPIATSMLLHSFTVFLEATALENRIQLDRNIYDTATCDMETERHRDQAYDQAVNQGREIPLPLDTDWVTDQEFSHLKANTFPTWLRERTGGTEIFIISSFRCPGGIDIPTAYWLPAIYEMRSFSNDINDLYSFAKEMLAGDTHSFIAMSTRDKRALGVPGTASDGGWCLRDTLKEMCGRVLQTSARINRILRPKGNLECRYGDDGKVLSVDEMVGMLKKEPIVEAGDGRKRQDMMSALALRLWETHQRGYVAYHLQSTRYRAFEMFDWVREMAGEKGEGPEWILDQFATPSAVTTGPEEADGGTLAQLDMKGAYGGHHQNRLSLLRRVTQTIKTWMGKQ